MLKERQSRQVATPVITVAAPQKAPEPANGKPSIEARLKDPAFVNRLKRLGLWYLRDDPKALEEQLSLVDANLRRRESRVIR
jgi:hypothetical protein